MRHFNVHEAGFSFYTVTYKWLDKPREELAAMATFVFVFQRVMQNCDFSLRLTGVWDRIFSLKVTYSTSV
jgi:hypothetical protein